MAFIVYIGESTVKIAEQIEQKLKENGLDTKTFGSLKALIKNTRESPPDIFVIDATLSPDLPSIKSIFSKIPTIIYADTLEGEEVLAYYEYGIKRVLLQLQNLPSRVAAATRMLLYRLNTLQAVRQKSLTQGTIQTFSFEEVLQNALLEKKNFILKVRHKNWEAKIRTFQGHFVKAVSTHLYNEDTILKTLQISSGSFLIRGYRKIEEQAQISASTLGILAEARFEQKEIRGFCGQFESANPQFRVSKDRRKQASMLEERELLELIAEHPLLQDILINSSLPVSKTLRMLKKFLGQGLITPEGPGEPARSFHPADIEYFRKLLFREGLTEGHLVVLGSPGSGRSEFVRTIAGFQQGKIKSVQSLDFTRIALQSDMNLTIFGLSIDETFLPVLEKLSERLLAFVFLIDYQDKEKYEFASYMLNQLTRIYKVPFVIGVSNIPGNPEKAVKEFKAQFHVLSDIDILAVQTDSFDDVLRLLRTLHPLAAETNEEKKNV